jgi:iron complex outermembrane receptor protein
MKVGIASILFILFSWQAIFAQNDSIHQIDEVLVYGHFLSKHQVGYSIITLSDSILKNDTNTFTALLKKHIGVYIKEQGYGMTASISMRGSGASHTAVYWNGIPINSALNGQTDFNTIFPSSYNIISIRKGGGSVLLGSGAIGGAVNLENQLQFNKRKSVFVQKSFGSYRTYLSAINIIHNTEKLAVQFGINSLKSKNDYPFSNSDVKNENGEIENYSWSLNTGLKLSHTHTLYAKGLLTSSDRNTSRTLYAPSNANLVYNTQKALLGWKHNNTAFLGELKVAYVKEEYSYTFDKNLPDLFSNNGSEKWFGNYNSLYAVNSKIQLQVGTTYQNLLGKGTDIESAYRQNFTLYTSLHHKLTDKVVYNLNIRREWSSNYTIPFVFSFDSRQDWYKHHFTKINVSTNYRTPTLNDLYWQPGGNINLRPEKNWNAEVSYEWNTTNHKLNVNLFRSQSTDLIQWQPINGNMWQPINIKDVTSSGFEFNFKSLYKINKHILSGNIHYSYTNSMDNQNHKQLLYVPYHLGGALLTYTYQKWILEYDEQYSGKVFTTTTNTESLDGYWLSNFTLKRSFLDKDLNISININNIRNKNYQIVASRPMPQRNYSINFNYKF